MDISVNNCILKKIYQKMKYLSKPLPRLSPKFVTSFTKKHVQKRFDFFWN